MSETLDYIESYFKGRLSPEDRQVFENRCHADKSFAEEVAFYIATRDGIRGVLNQEKKKEFEELYRKISPVKKQPGSIKTLRPLLAVAAACIIILLGWSLFFKTPSPEKIASAYIDNNFSTLGVKMGGNNDSLQLGLAAYNEKDYSRAEAIFKNLPENTEALRYLGIVYLVNGRYEEAIAQFDILSLDNDLYANPGTFYKAIALMKRSAPGDNEKAKSLLEEVAKKDLWGSKEAGEWLKHL